MLKSVWTRQNPQKIRLLGTVSAIGTSYYVYHLEKAPITGRVRFINIDMDQEETISIQSFDDIMRANKHLILQSNHPFCLRIKKIVENLAKNISALIPGIKANFHVYIIENSEPNAFVLPGGQIFVNTGLISIAKNDEGLATVLAHEIAHKLARHGAEKMSTYQFFSLLIGTAQLILTDFHNPLTNLMKNVLLDLPFSRKCESEADYIGLLLMAKSCYNPEESIKLWKRMAENSTEIEQNVNSFLSTHPSHLKRIANLRSWMPKAREIFENSECEGLLFKTFYNKA